MRILIFTLACLTLPLLCAAQTSDLQIDSREGTLNDRYALGYFMTPRGEVAAQGSVFLVPGWTPGQLYLAGNTKPIAAPLKYDIYSQEVRARRPNGDSVAVAVAKVKEFALANRHFVCYPAATLPTEVGGGCAEVLADGSHAQLLKFARKVLVKQSSQAGSYASSSTISVLEEQKFYYLRWPADGHFTPMRLKRASLEQVLAGQPAALAALKARKGSLNSEADMAAAVAAIDTLLTAPPR
ncbi:MAG TPA: hypothetical protein VFO93_14650 [Hymenobacter sp.]|uniref:hypothetical protein n=1 Tax=Hymenobacter sp. TaxID=1898978 RepID=UPI002D7F10D9|nr:hypothetical protein [Hymenobacter sp.]HET9504780.1 hypothetical protein [Hymenobacter sp.]